MNTQSQQPPAIQPAVDVPHQAPTHTTTTTIIQLSNEKNTGVAIILAIIFGPLGMLYSTVAGGIIMMIVSFVVALFTLGLGLIITWPICVIWAAVAANKKPKTTVVA